MTEISAETLQRVRNVKVVPVLTIPSVEIAIPLAKALIAGGIDVLEVTLRTPCALDAIKAMVDAGLDALIGAGTITTPRDVEAAKAAGAEFLVTPGTQPGLIQSLIDFGGPVFPGASSVSESLALRDAGFSVQKFFPAEAVGGAAYLKSLASPLPGISFMPTGGIKLETAGSYLSLKNVVAVGGSWLAPDDLVESGEWDVITGIALKTRAYLSDN